MSQWKKPAVKFEEDNALHKIKLNIVTHSSCQVVPLKYLKIGVEIIFKQNLHISAGGCVHTILLALKNCKATDK
jgi:hypothetical protein